MTSDLEAEAEAITIRSDERIIERLHKLHYDRSLETHRNDNEPFLLNPHDALALEVELFSSQQRSRYLSLTHTEDIQFQGRRIVIKASGEPEIALNRDLALRREYKRQKGEL